MIYADLPTLAIAVHQLDMTDIVNARYLSELINVYFNALHSAPSDLVGVGRITWAEDCLVEYQILNPKPEME
jgi:hypothetical protein